MKIISGIYIKFNCEHVYCLFFPSTTLLELFSGSDILIEITATMAVMIIMILQANKLILGTQKMAKYKLTTNLKGGFEKCPEAQTPRCPGAQMPRSPDGQMPN